MIDPDRLALYLDAQKASIEAGYVPLNIPTAEEEEILERERALDKEE